MIAAAGLLLATAAHSSSAIFEGEGFGTYYYNLDPLDVSGNDFSSMDSGQVECSLTQAWSLDQIGSNYLVAMNHTQLAENMSL